MEKKNTYFNTKRITGAAIFAALAFVVTMLTRWIKIAGFLSLDFKDAIITIASFVYGPLTSVAITVVVAGIEFFFSETGWYGLLMNIASSTTFALVASFIYSRKRNINSALIGLFSAVFATVAVMLALNVLITPLYFGMPRQAVVDMLPTVILPFNVAKTLMNSAIIMLLYKPIVMALRRAKLIKGEVGRLTFNRTSLVITITSLLCLITAIVIFIIIN
jgi:riboflavin transporter FmnP